MTLFPITGNEVVLTTPPQNSVTLGEIAAMAGTGCEPVINPPGSLTTNGAGTLTAALIVGRVITRTGTSGNFTDTTDTAAAIIAALPAPIVLNESFYLDLINNTVYAQTLQAGTGVTLSGMSGPIPANSTARAIVQVISLTAVTITLVEISYNAASGYEPSTVATQFGSGTATFFEEGNVSRQISAAGVSPGGTGADNVIATFTLPANSFDVSGRGLYIQAQGSFASNAHTKEVKIIFNPASATLGSTVGASGTTVCDTGSSTTTGGVGWQVSGFVFKYGANGSNTQICMNNGSVIGTTHLGVSAPVLATAAENGAIFIAVTGNATTTASDILFNWLEINALN